LLSAVARVQNNVRLLLPAGRGLALLVVKWATATPRRICVGAALSALLIGLGANAILKRVERHPPPSSAEANQKAAPAAAKVPDPWPGSAALSTGKEEAPSPALTAAPAAANASSPNSTEAAPAGPAPAAKAVPDALAEKHASRSKFARTPFPIQTRVGDSGELQSTARARDPIGDLLRGKHSGSGLPAPRQD
jgi:hypothetical protein